MQNHNNTTNASRGTGLPSQTWSSSPTRVSRVARGATSMTPLTETTNVNTNGNLTAQDPSPAKRAATLSLAEPDSKRRATQDRGHLFNDKENPHPQQPPQEQQVTTCCICINEPAPPQLAGINSGCAHVFCFDCVEEWAKIENTCPLCKERFTEISRLNTSNLNGASPTRQVSQRNQRSENGSGLLAGAILFGLAQVESLSSAERVAQQEMLREALFFQRGVLNFARPAGMQIHRQSTGGQPDPPGASPGRAGINVPRATDQQQMAPPVMPQPVAMQRETNRASATQGNHGSSPVRLQGPFSEQEFLLFALNVAMDGISPHPTSVRENVQDARSQEAGHGNRTEQPLDDGQPRLGISPRREANVTANDDEVMGQLMLYSILNRMADVMDQNQGSNDE